MNNFLPSTSGKYYNNQLLLRFIWVHKEVINSDANLSSHLGRRHQLLEFMYPSRRLRFQSKSQLLSPELKKELDDALIYAIVKDS